MFWETSWTDKKALVGLIFHECSYSFIFFSFCECITGQGKFSAAILSYLKYAHFKERSVFRTSLWWTPRRQHPSFWYILPEKNDFCDWCLRWHCIYAKYLCLYTRCLDSHSTTTWSKTVFANNAIYYEQLLYLKECGVGRLGCE